MASQKGQRGQRHQSAARRTDQRSERRDRRESKQQRRRLLYMVGSGIFGFAIIVGLFLPQVLPGSGGNTSFSRGDGPGQIFAELPATHIADGTSYAQYNSVPATSGPHYNSPLPWGIEVSPVPDERMLHNLEHGGVTIQYNTDDVELIARLEEFAEKQTGYPCFLKVAPYPDMGTTIAVTAWAVMDTMDEYDEDRLQSFVNAYRNDGPERVPCTQ